MFWPSSKNRCIADRFINPDGSWPKGYLDGKVEPGKCQHPPFQRGQAKPQQLSGIWQRQLGKVADQEAGKPPTGTGVPSASGCIGVIEIAVSTGNAS